MNICMIVLSHYPNDPRVRREAEALQRTDINVDVICLRGDKENKIDEHNGVKIYRVIKGSDKESILKYWFQENRKRYKTADNLPTTESRREEFPRIDEAETAPSLYLKTLPRKIAQVVNAPIVYRSISPPVSSLSQAFVLPLEFLKEQAIKVIRFNFVKVELAGN